MTGQASLRRGARSLRSTLLAALLATGFASAWAQQLADTPYADPDGRFTLTIPGGWDARTTDGIVSATDPEGAIQTWIVVVPSDDAAGAIGEAWPQVDPTFDLEPDTTVSPPSDGKVEEIVQISYKTDRDRIALGIGQRFQGNVYVLLIEAPVNAFVKRQAQVAVLASSLDIAGTTEADLAGVTPARLAQVAPPDLDSWIPQALARTRVPGAVVAIVQDGAVVYQKAFGVKELGRPEPMTVDTQLMIGSSSKSLATLMMATIVDDGLMTWDTPVVDVLPSFSLADPDATANLTMRNLVCACTGVPRRDMEFLFNADTLGAEDVVRSLSTFQLFTKPGETFQYSNQMVATGGYLAAVAAGADPDAMLPGFAAELQRRVLSPIGMLHTTLSMNAVRAADTYATPHGLRIGGESYSYVPIPLSEEHLLMPVAPSGALWSTAPDMARYLITLLQRGVTPEGARIVSEENLDQLFVPQVKMSNDASYALGWMIGSYKGLRLIEHGGNTFGFTTSLLFAPDAGIGVVVLTNARIANNFSDNLAQRVVDLAYGQDLKHLDDAMSLHAAEPGRGLRQGRAAAPAGGRPRGGHALPGALLQPGPRPHHHVAARRPPVHGRRRVHRRAAAQHRRRRPPHLRDRGPAGGRPGAAARARRR